MKIALVIERMDLARGGREKSTAGVAEALSRRGHDVTVLCQEGTWSAPGVTLRALGRRGWLRVSRLKGFVADVQEVIRAGEYDIVHTTLPVPGANVYQLRSGTLPAQQAAALERHCGLAQALVSASEPWNFCRRCMGELERAVMADPGVLCLPVSRMVALEIERHYGRTEGVRVVYNAVDVPDGDSPRRGEWRRQRREQIGAGADDLVFLTVATNFELKGVLQAVEALAGWHGRPASEPARPDAHLVVVGDSRGDVCQRRAGVRGIGDKVHFFPWTDEVFPWYAAADAVVLLSWYDPCSRVVLEATRWCIPSITTRRNGAAEVLAYGAGVVVESPREVDAVLAAMDELADPHRRRARAECCREAAGQLTMDRHVEELLAAYEEVLTRARKGST